MTTTNPAPDVNAATRANKDRPGEPKAGRTGPASGAAIFRALWPRGDR